MFSQNDRSIMNFPSGHGIQDRFIQAKQRLDEAKVNQSTFLPKIEGVGLELTPSREFFFPSRLHYMLKELEKDGMSHIISWQPHGRCFRVHDKKLFVEKILSTWFRQKKFTSFQRQLNLYGFERMSRGRDKGAYFHPLFRRGNGALCTQIKRIKVKGNGSRKASCPEMEPDFYTFPFLPDVDADENEKTLVSVTANQTFCEPGLTSKMPFVKLSSHASQLSSLDCTDALQMEANRVTQASIHLLNEMEKLSQSTRGFLRCDMPSGTYTTIPTTLPTRLFTTTSSIATTISLPEFPQRPNQLPAKVVQQHLQQLQLQELLQKKFLRDGPPHVQAQPLPGGPYYGCEPIFYY